MNGKLFFALLNSFTLLPVMMEGNHGSNDHPLLLPLEIGEGGWQWLPETGWTHLTRMGDGILGYIVSGSQIEGAFATIYYSADTYPWFWWYRSSFTGGEWHNIFETILGNNYTYQLETEMLEGKSFTTYADSVHVRTMLGPQTLMSPQLSFERNHQLHIRFSNTEKLQKWVVVHGSVLTSSFTFGDTFAYNPYNQNLMQTFLRIKFGLNASVIR